MLYPKLRKLAEPLAATPLHPKWLHRHRTSNQHLLSQTKGLVLDIGCASRWPETIIPPSCQYLALDYPKTGSQLYSSRPDIFADAAHIPIADNSIDSVLLFEVLEHLAEPKQALIEIHRILKPGGKLLLSIPFLYPMHDEPHDYQRYTRYGLVRELEAAGLQALKVEPNLNSAATAGLIATLAISGMTLRACQERSLIAFLCPFVALSIPLINLAAWTAGRLLPDWPAITSGYIAVAVKR